MGERSPKGQEARLCVGCSSHSVPTNPVSILDSVYDTIITITCAYLYVGEDDAVSKSRAESMKCKKSIQIMDKT